MPEVIFKIRSFQIAEKVHLMWLQICEYSDWYENILSEQSEQSEQSVQRPEKKFFCDFTEKLRSFLVPAARRDFYHIIQKGELSLKAFRPPCHSLFHQSLQVCNHVSVPATASLTSDNHFLDVTHNL